MKTKLNLEQLSNRYNPSTLDVQSGLLSFTGDGGNDTVTQSVSGTGIVFSANTTINLTPTAYSAGFRANGIVAAGPRVAITNEIIDLGIGTNTVNIRANDVPMQINCNGIDTVNICGNAPTNTVDLSGILGQLNIIAIDNNDTLNVSDNGSISGNTSVAINTAGIYGLADNADILTNGIFLNEKITGSNSNTPENYDLSGSAGPLTLKTGAGNDSVTISADMTTYNSFIDLGIGNDSITVLYSFTFNGSVNTGPGFDTINVGGSLYGTVTGGVI